MCETNEVQSNPVERPRVRALFQKMEVVEAWAGAFLGTVLAVFFVMGVLSGIAPLMMVAAPTPLFYVAFLSVVALTEGPFLIRLWKCTLAMDLPIGPAVAAQLRPWFPLLGPVTALWWAAHFAAGMILLVLFMQDAAQEPRPVAVLGMMFALLGVAVAGNVYLAVAVKRLTGSDAIVAFLWRHRFLLDFAMSLLCTMVAF